MSSVFGINDCFMPLDSKVVSLDLNTIILLVIAITITRCHRVEDVVVVLKTRLCGFESQVHSFFSLFLPTKYFIFVIRFLY